MDALMVTLRNRFKSLSSEDVQAIGDLYTITLSTMTTANANPVNRMIKLSPGPAKQVKINPVPVEPGGDKACGSPAASVAAEHSPKEILSSSEDDFSLGETPSGVVYSVLPHLSAPSTMA